MTTTKKLEVQEEQKLRWPDGWERGVIRSGAEWHDRGGFSKERISTERRTPTMTEYEVTPKDPKHPVQPPQEPVQPGTTRITTDEPVKVEVNEPHHDNGNDGDEQK